jgi:hypothetical protein
MVRGTEKGARWEEIVDRWPFRKGVDHGRPLGIIYTMFYLEVSLTGLPMPKPGTR